MKILRILGVTVFCLLIIFVTLSIIFQNHLRDYHLQRRWQQTDDSRLTILFYEDALGQQYERIVLLDPKLNKAGIPDFLAGRASVEFGKYRWIDSTHITIQPTKGDPTTYKVEQGFQELVLTDSKERFTRYEFAKW